MASRLAVAAVVVLLLVAGADAIVHRGGGGPSPRLPAPSSPEVAFEPVVGNISVQLTPPPRCRGSESVAVECDHWTGYAVDPATVTFEMRPR